MESAQYLWLLGLIPGTTDLYLNYKSSFALERPVQSVIAVLLVSGVALVILSFLIPGAFSSETPPSDYTTIPLTNVDGKVTEEETQTAPDFNRMRSRSLSYSQANQFSIHRIRTTFLLLVAAICVRVELSRWIIADVQCATLKLAPWIPLLVVIHEIFTLAAKTLSSTIFTNPRGTSRFSALNSSPLRYVLPVIALTGGAALLFGVLGELRSTYICASGLPNKTIIPLLQALGTLLDTSAIILASHLIFGGSENNPYASQRSPLPVGLAFLASCALIFLNGLLVYLAVPSKREWINSYRSEFVWSTIRASLDVTLTVICACQTVCHFGVRNASVICLFIYINIQSILTGWFRSWPFPPVSKLSLAVAIFLIFGGFISYLWIDGSSTNKGVAPLRSNRKPTRVAVGLGVLIALQISLWFIRPRFVYHKHPVDVLMHEAEMAHKVWARQASNSSTVYEAAANYRRRYHRDPPPRFNKWFEFAQARNSTIIDDFDNIYRDLLPFWSMDPKEIRARTYHMLANDWNNIGGITIRKDNMSLSPYVEESHRWMLKGIMSLIEPFVEFLPDMDLAFNMDDECRVAVPYRGMQKIMKNATSVRKLPAREDGDFSSVRHNDWAKLPEDPIKDTIYREKFANRTYWDYGSVGCAPSSKARTESRWDVGSVCLSCIKPHSHHNFIRNWTHAADPCHQPDLAHLHGLHLSPSTFRVTHELMPLFSQSKAHGFQDILYPSAWNYGNRTVYNASTEYPDPGWYQKDPTFYWRGRTSEGLSFENGLWKGMGRQRLVHHFNNASSSQRNLVILPTGNTAAYHSQNNNQPIFTYRHLTPPVLHQQISTDVRFVDRIDRCVRRDCDDQYTEFAPQYVANTSFQAHWRYKYLMDLDGAGFSGRFLAFLQSHSLPFKSSLMREWWDGRITAWVHFVPVDVRLTEMWSLLAYFAGWRLNPGHGEEEQPQWLMKPHDREGQTIAEVGSEWAQKVLRREDMEVYMFRLLLEWGRLTDDHRDSLGWTGDQ